MRRIIYAALISLAAACGEPSGQDGGTGGGTGATGGGSATTGGGSAATGGGSATTGGGTGTGGGMAVDGGPTVAFTLQILHASDQESGVPAVEDAPRFSAVMARLEAEFPSTTLKLANGDLWLPGVFLNAGGDPVLSMNPSIRVAGAARADVAIFNELGLHVASLGNHEFDNGPAFIASAIRPDPASPLADGGTTRWGGARFPYLTSNLDITTDPGLRSAFIDGGAVTTATDAGLTPSSVHGRITPSLIVQVGTERVGIVAATTPLITTIAQAGAVTVKPPNPTDFDALAVELQRYIDELTAAGVTKIILMGHMQQFSIEADQLPQRLNGVDIILAGGSHAIWGDSDDVLRTGEVKVSDYPLWRTSKDGKPVAVLNVASNWRYVGRFLARFTAAGELVRTDADAPRSGAYATDEAGVNRLDAGSLVNPRVQSIADAVGAVISAKDGTVYGTTTVFLNGTREAVRTRETNFGSLTADANLRTARLTDPTAVISLKNGGGIRDNIGTVGTGATPTFEPPAANPLAGKLAGQVSRLDIENSLRFNNALSLITVDARQLQLAMEHGFAGTAPTATPGQFPQIGGMRVEYDSTRPAQVLPSDGGVEPTTVGQRVRTLEVFTDAGTVVVVSDGGLAVDPATTFFRMVTLDFIAGGGDNYPFGRFAALDAGALNRVNLYASDGGPRDITADGSEQKALADYFLAVHPPDGGTPYSVPDGTPSRIIRLNP